MGHKIFYKSHIFGILNLWKIYLRLWIYKNKIISCIVAIIITISVSVHRVRSNSQVWIFFCTNDRPMLQNNISLTSNSFIQSSPIISFSLYIYIYRLLSGETSLFYDTLRYCTLYLHVDYNTKLTNNLEVCSSFQHPHDLHAENTGVREIYTRTVFPQLSWSCNSFLWL